MPRNTERFYLFFLRTFFATFLPLLTFDLIAFAGHKTVEAVGVVILLFCLIICVVVVVSGAAVGNVGSP